MIDSSAGYPPVMPAQAGIHDSYEVSPVKWKFAHLVVFPSVVSYCPRVLKGHPGAWLGW